jgi:hypothetical protein
MSLVKININLIKSRPRIWRVRHDAEMSKGIWRPGMPEVHPTFDNHHSRFDRWAQLVSRGMNPWLDDDGWTDIYHHRYWITNDQGFGDEVSPRANYVLGKDLTSELPRVESLVSGGSLVESVDEDQTWVYLKALDWRNPVSLSWLQTKPQFWTRGIFCGGNGIPRRMLGHLYEGPPIIHPFIADTTRELRIEKHKLQLWTAVDPPDPMKLYYA